MLRGEVSCWVCLLCRSGFPTWFRLAIRRLGWARGERSGVVLLLLLLYSSGRKYSRPPQGRCARLPGLGSWVGVV